MTTLRRFAYWLIRMEDWKATRREALKRKRNYQRCHDIATQVCRIKTTNIQTQRYLNAAKDELYGAASCFRDEEDE